MARKSRVHVPGGLFHVMVRGNAGQDIFFDDEDRYRLYVLLQEGVERFGHRIHAFCLMSNHVHLAVQVADTRLSKVVQNFAFRYTRWVNSRQGRTGHLFQGRYQAILVDADAYALELVRYIHLNPVRAGLVTDPLAYPWSGHRAYLGHEVLPWLSIDWALAQFAKRLGTSRARYSAFVAAGADGGYREDFHRGTQDSRVLGNDQFVELALAQEERRVARAVASLSSIESRVCRAYGMSRGELCRVGREHRRAEARAVVAYAAVWLGSAPLTDVATHFGRDISTMSLAARRLAIRLRAGELSPEARRAFEALELDYQNTKA